MITPRAWALRWHTTRCFLLPRCLLLSLRWLALCLVKMLPGARSFGRSKDLLGKKAIAVQGLLKNANQPIQSIFATVVSIVTLVIGATTVFGELQSDLDRIWRVPAPLNESGVWALLRNRLLSFGFVLGLVFLLLISLVVSAVIAAFGKWSHGYFEGWETFFQVLNFSISFVITTLLFAMIYKFMPRAKIAWRDVWIGAAVTAFLFEIGKFLIGIYLGTTSVASVFGAAGSLVVLLVWVYFSAQIFLLGAEFTWVYSHEYGSKAAQADQKSALMVPSHTGDVAINKTHNDNVPPSP